MPPVRANTRRKSVRQFSRVTLSSNPPSSDPIPPDTSPQSDQPLNDTPLDAPQNDTVTPTSPEHLSSPQTDALTDGMNVINEEIRGEDNTAPQCDDVSGPSQEEAVTDGIAVINEKTEGEDNSASQCDAAEKSSDAVTLGSGEKSTNGVVLGGKTKKMVKRTVKVVRKVIKKVPKKTLKVGAENDIGNVVGLGNVNDSNCGGGNVPSLIDDSKLISESLVEGEMKGRENLSSEGLPSAKIEGKKDDFGVEFEGRGLIEDCIVENSSLSSAKNEGNEGKKEGFDVEVKGSELMDVDNGNVGDVEVRNEEDVTKVGNGEGRDDNVKGGEEERGEGRLFRGEMEMMERRKRRKTQIFIGGLSKDVKVEDVRKVFGEAGEIVDLKLHSNADKSKKFAFLRFASADEAKRALEKYSRTEICGKECSATFVEGNDTIYLGNIDKKWKDQDVVKLLHDAGIEKIDMITVLIDPNKTECNRGFAFLEFETIKDAQIAYKKLQKENVFGMNRKIKVAWAEPLKELNDEEMRKVKTVFAEFIPSSWDEQKVRNIFNKFGEIEDISLAQNQPKTKRKDIAFITYKIRESAIECIESCNRGFKDEDGSKVNVKVSLAKPSVKGKKLKPAPSREVAKAKPLVNHGNARMSEPRSRLWPGVPQHDLQLYERPSSTNVPYERPSSTNVPYERLSTNVLYERPSTNVLYERPSSTNVELVRLLREQASWSSPHASLSNSPRDLHYASPLSGVKRQYSAMEPNPPYPDMRLYPRSRLDDSVHVASSSQNVIPPSGLTSSVAYPQRHGVYPSGSLSGARNYPTEIEVREKAHRNIDIYRRY